MDIREFYLNVFRGNDYPDLDRLLSRAELTVEGMISRKPTTAEETRLYSTAVCVQAEYIGLQGGVEGWVSSSSGGFTIGSFSMSGGSSEGGNKKIKVCDEALNLLDRAGLLFRRCCVV